MGYSSFSATEYETKTSSLKARGYGDHFVHDADVKAGRVAATTHSSLDPNGVTVRESRDSEEHPVTTSIGVLFDVTGSMQRVPRVLQKKLPELMGVLKDRKIVEGPQILFGGIGDATCDSAPVQIGQFESGIEMDNDLGNIYLEGGGGSYVTESYELSMYFMARHTSMDCLEKRNKKAYLFIIGDEKPYDHVNKSQVERIFGDTLQSNLPTKEIVEELKQKYEVYFIMPGGTSNYKNKFIVDSWKELFGQNVLFLDDASLVCELIAAQIGVKEGTVSVDKLDDILSALNTNNEQAETVKKALNPV